MKSGDQVILVIKEQGQDDRWVMKEILIDAEGVLAVTTPETYSGWPGRLRLRPERIEASAMPFECPILYIYQDTVSRPQ